MNRLSHIKVMTASVALILSFLFMGIPAEAADKDNCLMCHRYRFLGRIDESGKRINYYVSERIYDGTVHRKVSCRECHTYIKKIPHDPVKEPVDCGTKCHLTTPFSKEKFSHERIINIFQKSAHAPKPGDPTQLMIGKPDCKFCHLNPIYTIPEQRIPYHESLLRCLNCHQEKGVTQAYKHIMHRIRKKTSRSSQEIVELCAKCHDDVELMKKFDVSKKALTAVETYKQSIHGKAVTLGSEKAADCISCHASNKLHDIRKKDDKESTISKTHLKATCKQCHEKTNDWFVKIAVHPTMEREENPIIYVLNLGFRFALYGTVFGLVGLMFLETRGRRKDGIKFLLRKSTSWRGKAKEKGKK